MAPFPKLPRMRSTHTDEGSRQSERSGSTVNDSSPVKVSTVTMPTGSFRRASVHNDKKVFYINVTDANLYICFVLCLTLSVLDASVAIEKKVTQNLTEKQAPLPGPQSFKDKVAKSVGKKAGERIPPSKVAEKMAEKMPKMLPLKMKKKGLTVAVELVFLEGPYFVLQVQVCHVDMAKMVEASQRGKSDNDDSDDDDSVASTKDLDGTTDTQQQEEEDVSGTENVCMHPATSQYDGFAGFVEWLLQLLGVKYRTHLEKEYLPEMIQHNMSNTMGDMLRQKYESKGIKTDAQTIPEEKQARYFYANLKKVREK